MAPFFGLISVGVFCIPYDARMMIRVAFAGHCFQGSQKNYAGLLANFEVTLRRCEADVALFITAPIGLGDPTADVKRHPPVMNGTERLDAITHFQFGHSEIFSSLMTLQCGTCSVYSKVINEEKISLCPN